MKTLINLILILLFTGYTACGQRIVEKNIKIPDKQDISLDFQFADEINITGWDKNEISIKVTVNINDNQHNDKFRLDIDDHNWFIDITSEIEDLEELGRESLTISKKNGSRKIIKNGNKVDLNLKFEVKVPAKNAIEVTTISGDIIGTGLLGELKMESISGFIDISVPADHNADLNMNTVTGGMYTDFDFSLKAENGMHHFGSSELKTTLNNGGTDIELETVSGDLYIRKETR